MHAGSTRFSLLCIRCASLVLLLYTAIDPGGVGWSEGTRRCFRAGPEVGFRRERAEGRLIVLEEALAAVVGEGDFGQPGFGGGPVVPQPLAGDVLDGVVADILVGKADGPGSCQFRGGVCNC